MERSRPWADDEVWASELITKRQLFEAISSCASAEFLERHDLFGRLDIVLRTHNRRHFCRAYSALYASAVRATVRCRTQITEHTALSIEHRAQSKEQSAERRCTEHAAQSPEC